MKEQLELVVKELKLLVGTVPQVEKTRNIALAYTSLEKAQLLTEHLLGESIEAGDGKLTLTGQANDVAGVLCESIDIIAEEIASAIENAFTPDSKGFALMNAVNIELVLAKIFFMKAPIELIKSPKTTKPIKITKPVAKEVVNATKPEIKKQGE